jgi:xanthine dehydrogenase accessory factor
MSFDLTRLTETVRAHGAVVRLLVSRSAGSAPRDAGTSMLIWEGGTEGTIGGGTLEFQAIAEARDMLATTATLRHRAVPLGPALGQCCGGSVTLVWERFDEATLPASLPYARPLGPAEAMPATVARKAKALQPGALPAEIDGWLIEAAPAQRRPLWIWGAGHVGRALVDVLRPLPDFEITWVDTGPHRFPSEVPSGITTLPAAEPSVLAAHAPREAEHLVLTFSHEIDLSLCHALLSRGFKGLGLIGSATKWARFKSRLAALGHTREEIARIACPIGDPTLGKHPHAIALGVATSLLKRADNREIAEGDRHTA